MDMNLEKFRQRLTENFKNRSPILEAATSEQMGHGEAANDSATRRDSVIVDIVRNRGNEPQLVSVIKHVAAEHRWLDTIDNFANLMANMWFSISRNPHTKETAEENSTDGVLQEVIIALIDDGVDVLAPELSGRIVGGKSFDSGKPYYVSETGHGTIMASMIARVCPMAKLYPIRLKLILGEDGKGRVDLKSAAWVCKRMLVNYCILDPE
jgi:hypothetical protein